MYIYICIYIYIYLHMILARGSAVFRHLSVCLVNSRLVAQVFSKYRAGSCGTC